jgi:hypothetical protein
VGLVTTIPGYQLVLDAPADMLALGTIGMALSVGVLALYLAVWGPE